MRRVQTPLPSSNRIPFLSIIPLLLASSLAVSGCQAMMRALGSLSGSEQSPESEQTILQKQQEELQQRQVVLEKSLSQQVTLGRDLEERVARLNMLLIEKEAQVDELNSRLGEAILEVVRAKAKLRSLESKAEAASNLAEAEIALKALHTKSPQISDDPKYVRAVELLRLGAEEFKKQNFGGALYLSGQAKGLIRESQEQSLSRQDLPLLLGEIPFTLPVRLKARDASNLRAAPTLNSKVMTRLQAGDPLIGHSYRGKWVRVQNGSGQVGWVYYDLVGAR